MGQALYRSYRSKSFDEVVGQEHITDTLGRAIKSGRISHAYLFTGPRGVGKTSVARILAHEVNGLPYGGESIHLDIIEIDAASNRRIDEIRDLRDKVHISPTSAKYKVYIIDEVHMLTREAFNALLKTLEEPPAHCIFILATTEGHKLPETIVSRTQRFNFKPIDVGSAVKHLKKIADKEKIKTELPALELIARYSEGSFRDSISTLEQLSSVTKVITVEEVRKQLGLPSTDAVNKIIEYIEDKNPADLLKLLSSLNEQAIDSIMLAKSISQVMRARIVDESVGPADFNLLKDLIEIPASLQPAEALEIALLEAAYPENAAAPTINTKSEAPIESPPQEKIKPVSEKAVTNSAQTTSFSIDKWNLVLEDIKTQAASLYTALRLATPTLEDKTLYLHFEFPLHQKKLNQAANKNILSDTIEKMTGQRLTIKCLVLEKPAKQVSASQTNRKEDSELTTISNIFGNAEVLESS